MSLWDDGQLLGWGVSHVAPASAPDGLWNLWQMSCFLQAGFLTCTMGARTVPLALTKVASEWDKGVLAASPRVSQIRPPLTRALSAWSLEVDGGGKSEVND